MSFGSMDKTAMLAEVRAGTDGEGFATKQVTVLATFRVYREGRHGSYRWANLAAFSEATDLFRFRSLPNITVEPGQLLLCDGDRFCILSVEDVKSRGMYIEVLARKVVPEHGES